MHASSGSARPVSGRLVSAALSRSCSAGSIVAFALAFRPNGPGLRAQVLDSGRGCEQPQGSRGLSARHDSLSDAYRSLRSVSSSPRVVTRRHRTPCPGRRCCVADARRRQDVGHSECRRRLCRERAKTVAVNADFRRPALAARLMDDGATAVRSATLEEATALTASFARHTHTHVRSRAVDVSSVKVAPGDFAVSRLVPSTELAPCRM